MIAEKTVKRELSMKKLALIGVTGPKSGSVLVEYLAANAEEIKKRFPGGIVVLCREKSDTAKVSALLPDARILRGNLKDASFLSAAFEDVDTVVHVAGIQMSPAVTDAAVEKKVRRLILVHTTGIYSKYKEAGEAYRQIDEYVENKCRDNCILLSVLRPTMIYGNIFDNNVVQFVKMVDKFPVMPVVNGARYELQPVHYKDLGKAYYDVLVNEEITANRHYILSGGEVLQLRDMLTEIGKNLGKKVRFFSVPFWLAYFAAWCLWLVSLKKIDYREKVQRLCEPRTYSHEAATRDFGYAPMRFCDGIRDEVRQYLTPDENS